MPNASVFSFNSRRPSQGGVGFCDKTRKANPEYVGRDVTIVGEDIVVVGRLLVVFNWDNPRVYTYILNDSVIRVVIFV